MTIEKLYPGGDYVPCRISNSKFLSAVFRYSNFNFNGTVSIFSEYLLGNTRALKLMGQRNACIELQERAFGYACTIKNCTQERLETLINLTKELCQELDAL